MHGKRAAKAQEYYPATFELKGPVDKRSTPKSATSDPVYSGKLSNMLSIDNKLMKYKWYEDL